MERYGFNIDGTVSIKKFIEDEGKVREQIETLLSENGFKLISERIKIKREKIIEMLNYLPHDLENYDKYTNLQLLLTVCLLQNRDNPFVISYFKDEKDKKNLVATYESNKFISLESYINPDMSHPKNYNFCNDAVYYIYKKKANNSNENIFKYFRLPN